MYEKRHDALKFDLEASYNMQDINNTQAMGYDNLDKRSGASSDSRTFESSHESVFDKMLADYYLSQRGDYAETNKTMQQLTQVFEAKQASKKGFRDHTYGDNIQTFKMEQDMNKDEKPSFLARDAKKVFELDVLTH